MELKKAKIEGEKEAKKTIQESKERLAKLEKAKKSPMRSTISTMNTNKFVLPFMWS